MFLLLLGFMAAPTPTAGATVGAMVVTSDTTLTQDHHGSVIIAADDVTLDCAGHLVTASSGDQGIWVDSRDDVTITRCGVTGALNGIAVTGFSQRTSVIGNVTFDNVNAGIAADQAVAPLIRRNVSRHNGGNGIQVIQADDAMVVANHSLRNGDKGIGTSDSDTGTFLRNTVRGNVGWGFVIGHASEGNLVARNAVEATVGVGLLVVDSPMNVVRRNLVRKSGSNGIELVHASGTKVVGNDVVRNGSLGPDHNGLLVVSSTTNVFRSNRVTGNASTGIALVETSDGQLLVGNMSSGNGGMGFHIFTASNLVRDNVASRNADTGFRLSGPGAARNTIVRNRACGNRVIDSAEDPDVGNGNRWIANRFCVS